MAKITNADGSVTVDLEYPISDAGETVSQLTLRRVKGKEFRQINLTALAEKGDALLAVIGQLAAIPPSSLDQLDGSDIVTLGEVVTGFFKHGRATGAGSSPNAPIS